jgi:hypothetical protein
MKMNENWMMASSATSEPLSHENENGMMSLFSFETVRVIWGYEYIISLAYVSAFTLRLQTHNDFFCYQQKRLVRDHYFNATVDR